MELQEKTIKVRQMIETVVKRTIDPKWRFTQSGMVALYIQNGLQQLPALFGVSDIDDERIVDYLVYQIYRYRTSLANGSWQYTYLFSQAALEKYRNQFLSTDGKSGMNFYINQWLDEAELSRGQLYFNDNKAETQSIEENGLSCLGGTYKKAVSEYE